MRNKDINFIRALETRRSDTGDVYFTSSQGQLSGQNDGSLIAQRADSRALIHTTSSSIPSLTECQEDTMMHVMWVLSFPLPPVFVRVPVFYHSSKK